MYDGRIAEKKAPCRIPAGNSVYVNYKLMITVKAENFVDFKRVLIKYLIDRRKHSPLLINFARYGSFSCGSIPQITVFTRLGNIFNNHFI